MTTKKNDDLMLEMIIGLDKIFKKTMVENLERVSKLEKNLETIDKELTALIKNIENKIN
jgi:hypothetical protein